MDTFQHTITMLREYRLWALGKLIEEYTVAYRAKDHQTLMAIRKRLESKK